MKDKSGFTLIEMLVVVLIIGILAGIALPQYTLAVEKARSAEALMNLATIKREIQFYITANGLPTDSVSYKDFATVELSGGEWRYNVYQTKFFDYNANIDRNGGYIEIRRIKNEEGDYDLVLMCYTFESYFNDDSPSGDGWYCSCITELTDFGQKMCKAIYEPLGFKYYDGEY